MDLRLIHLNETANPVIQSAPILQRACACGLHSIGGAECRSCSERNHARPLQRSAFREPMHDVAASPSKSSHRAAQENRTRIPAGLRAGIEQLSGFDLSGVRVLYNASEPAGVGAFAYTRGKDIFIGPGQEKHLMHEAWHVVQQMQGRVNPTIQLQGHSINDDKGLEREADVMGAKAGEIGKQFHHTEFRAQLANAAGAITDDRPFTSTLRQSIQRVPRPLRESITDPGTKPVIQRVAKWVAGTETATTNLAAHVISGKRDMGFTPPTLNGTAAMSAANAQGALKPPTIVTTPNADGTHSSKVDSVDTNEASYTMSLPGPGPWSTVTAKAKVVALFSSLGLAAQAACAAAGDTTFTFNGKPNDKDFADNVKTHEKIHASDHKIGFDHVIVPWDKKLEDAKTAGTTFNGANAPAAQAALFKAMGGTPNEIATAQLNEWVRLNNITHKGKTLATGATATPSNSAADPTCSTSSIDAT